MAIIDINNIFRSVKENMSSGNKPSIYNEKLKFKEGCTYRLRIIPYVKEGPEKQYKTIRKVVKFYWTDPSNGFKKSSVSLMNVPNAECPIAMHYFRLLRAAKTKEEKTEIRRDLNPQDTWYYNVYVLEDSSNPENVGKVKILGAGRQINKVIDSALTGEYDKIFRRYGKKDYEVGPHVFDISDNGVDLIIEPVERNGMNNYESTSFVPAEVAIPDSVYDECFDLETLDPVPSVAEIEKIFNETYIAPRMGGFTSNIATSSTVFASQPSPQVTPYAAVARETAEPKPVSEVNFAPKPAPQSTEDPDGTTTEKSLEDFFKEFD